MAILPFSVPTIEAFAIPGVSFLICFLAYTSQVLFYYIEPGPLTQKEALWFNGFVLGIWWCYRLACTTDPGPKGWVDKVVVDHTEDTVDDEDADLKRGMRWCKKCTAVKPPRAHHCRRCGRCIPKMDHHCPWTTNCVSHTNFPHFVRFVFYAVVSMSILQYHLYFHALYLWDNRNIPAYLGPSAWWMAYLFVLISVNSITLFALTILLVTAAHSLAINTTMIEHWEIQRHEALVDRSRKLGGLVYSNNGKRVRVQHQEYPYDIGIWTNLVQAMGTRNVLLWLMPFGGAPIVDTALDWGVNGFEDPGTMWPPIDPEKLPRAAIRIDASGVRDYDTPEEEMEAFRRRQQEDFMRRGWGEDGSHEENEGNNQQRPYGFYGGDEEESDMTDSWTNADGDRLADFGVDEEVEDEDDIPLGELLRRRKKNL
ncbi:DHHC palmitoyltransferase-domain-containing protein [Calycina marina]|uniref:Palmitoyltransferase PFA4 n=1 Tax=Calycina marina TaxID=1763456 RepID=A0A9P8CI77_9HELO|nr:DHHC palmitoyltransferase-domain-containing protein [Calycina marina]